MITMLMPCFCFNRRHLARSSKTLSAGVSSMNSLALAKILDAALQLLILVVLEVTLPELFRTEFGFSPPPVAEPAGQSSSQGKKTATGTSWSTAMFRAMDSTKAVLPIPRARSQHYHVRTLPTSRELIQGIESGGHTTHAVFIETGLVDAIDHLAHDRTHFLHTLTDIALGHLKKLLLRAVQQVKYISCVFKKQTQWSLRKCESAPAGCTSVPLYGRGLRHWQSSPHGRSGWPHRPVRRRNPKRPLCATARSP